MKDKTSLSDLNRFSLEEKLDILFDLVEETAKFWDDDAAVIYREKMFSLRKEFNIIMKDKDKNA